jgi:hypothetical protein
MKAVKQQARAWMDWLRLPAQAKAELRKDKAGLPDNDPGPERAVEEMIGWMCQAQDHSSTQDGGVARHYSLIDGWSPSYPETTGYIVATLIDCGEQMGRPDLIDRARRMLDWLVSIQFPEGGFQGGMINQTPRVPVTFNTGQILIGLAAGVRVDEKYREPLRRAADWLVNTQDPDGCWRKHPTPFAKPGEKTYETHVSLGLFRAAKAEPGRGYLESASRQVDWALTHLRPNGWLASCCLTDPARPFTHTLGYALRGIVEAYLATKTQRYLQAGIFLGDGLLGALGPNGRLPGRLESSWHPAGDFVCLTGTSQVAESWLLLHKETGRADYRDAGLRANAFVRRTICLDGNPGRRGGVKGSFPVNGIYGQWQYLNWACKFTIDANREQLMLGTEATKEQKQPLLTGH